MCSPFMSLFPSRPVTALMWCGYVWFVRLMLVVRDGTEGWSWLRMSEQYPGGVLLAVENVDGFST